MEGENPTMAILRSFLDKTVDNDFVIWKSIKTIDNVCMYHMGRMVITNLVGLLCHSQIAHEPT